MLPFFRPRIAAAVLLALMPGPQVAHSSAATQAKKPEPAAQPVRPAPSDDQDPLKYCANVAATAGAARLARQEKQLREVEEQIKQRRDELDARRKELVLLMEKYDAQMRKADDAILSLYTKMKPDAAALQIGSLDDDLAAAVLIQMKPKSSSAIFNEMEAARGAAIAKKLVGLSTLSRTGKVQ